MRKYKLKVVKSRGFAKNLIKYYFKPQHMMIVFGEAETLRERCVINLYHKRYALHLYTCEYNLC